ncbi:MAG: DUF4136 domain-containing protein [Cetobacterium sp.]
MKKIYILIFGIIMLMIQGCSSIQSKVVAVDSYSTHNTFGGTYYLTTNTQGMQLQQDYFASQLQYMLGTKGYTRLNDKKYAQYIINYNYDVSGPFTSVQSYQVPVNPWWGAGYYGGVYGGYYGTTWTNSVEASTYFVKKLEVSAYDKNNNPIWQVVGTLKSSDSELRDSFPYLVSGIAPYVNENSNKIVYVSVPMSPNN